MTIETIHREEPAFQVIEKLGGKAAVASVLNVDKSTLSRWCQQRPQGTGGAIPQRHWPKLIDLGRKQGTHISLEELVDLES